MSELDRIINEKMLPEKLSEDVSFGAIKFSEIKLEQNNGGENSSLFFDDSFFEDVKKSAKRWEQKAVTAAKIGVLVPASIIGFNSGLGFPDKDISLLGIGSHRYWLFHSAFAVWVLEKFYKAYLAKQSGDLTLLDRITRKLLGVIGGGAAWGVGVHLAIDVFQPKSVVFPFFGSLIDGTLVDDRMWLLGNSLWCFKIGNDFFALGLGDDFQNVKDYVKQTFINPLKEDVRDVISGSD